MNLQTVPAVCRALGVSERRVRLAIQRGRLKAMKVGNRLLVDMDVAREIFAREPEAATIEDVKRETGLTVSAIRRGIREGWIPYEKSGKEYIFDIEKVQKALRKRMK